MSQTLRKSDSSAESEVGKYLDKYFYPIYTSNFKRFSDIENQMLGIDAVCDYKNFKNIIIDEKAAIHYINKDIPTFAFEINFISSSNLLINGWLFDESKKTQFYLLCWIKAKKDNNLTCDDITEIDCILIDRSKIINMLAQFGCNISIANSTANEIRNNAEVGVSRKDFNKPFYFYYTNHLSERPINIVIKKNKLIELSEARFTIKP